MSSGDPVGNGRCRRCPCYGERGTKAHGSWFQNSAWRHIPSPSCPQPRRKPRKAQEAIFRGRGLRFASAREREHRLFLLVVVFGLGLLLLLHDRLIATGGHFRLL